MNRYLLKSFLPIGVCLLISFDGLLPAAFAQGLPARIDILVMEGEGATNSVRQRAAHDPAVKVEDDDHRPIASAVVVFALPVSGTSGEFANGSKTLTLMTDKNGLATAHGLKTNDIPGNLQIYVTASYHTLQARTLINQLVESPAGTKPRGPEVQTSKASNKWKWVLLGVAAAGGAGAGVYYGSHNSSSSASSAVSISTGAVVFGSPR